MEKTMKIKDDAIEATPFVVEWAKDKGPFSLQELQTYLLGGAYDDFDDGIAPWNTRAMHSMSHLRNEIFAQSEEDCEKYGGYLVKLNRRGRGQLIPIKEVEEAPTEQIEFSETLPSDNLSGGVTNYLKNLSGLPIVDPSTPAILDELIRIRNLSRQIADLNKEIIKLLSETK